LLALGATRPSLADSTINSANRLAYGANTGWMDWRADGTNGVVIGEYCCSGWMYGANVGWICLGDGSPTNLIRYSNASARDCGVNLARGGRLRGFAWSPAIGWLNFEERGDPRVDLLTGSLAGHVWSANAGWIGLSNSHAHVQTDALRRAPDNDGDGFPDAWELDECGSVGELVAERDSDGDGMTDWEEYVAGTKPMDWTSRLRVISFTITADRRPRLVWRSGRNRLYRIEVSDDLRAGGAWRDCGLGLLGSEYPSLLMRAIPAGGAHGCLFRVVAALPRVE
jgi:hypothetical protein